MSSDRQTRRRWLAVPAMLALALTACAPVPAPSAAPTAAPSASPVASASTGSSSAGPGGLVQVPGASVWMVPQGNFVAATTFAGFGEPNGAVIEVTEIPDPYAVIAPQVDAETLAEQGIEMDTRDEATLNDGSPAILISGTQTIDGLDFQKVILVTGDEDSSVLITANIPFTAADDIEHMVVAMLLSTTLDPI